MTYDIDFEGVTFTVDSGVDDPVEACEYTPNIYCDEDKACLADVEYNYNPALLQRRLHELWLEEDARQEQVEIGDEVDRRVKEMRR